MTPEISVALFRKRLDAVPPVQARAILLQLGGSHRGVTDAGVADALAEKCVAAAGGKIPDYVRVAVRRGRGRCGAHRGAPCGGGRALATAWLVVHAGEAAA